MSFRAARLSRVVLVVACAALILGGGAIHAAAGPRGNSPVITSVIVSPDQTTLTIAGHHLVNGREPRVVLERRDRHDRG